LSADSDENSIEDYRQNVKKQETVKGRKAMGNSIEND
jgi:hypothetical protein